MSRGRPRFEHAQSSILDDLEKYSELLETVDDEYSESVRDIAGRIQQDLKERAENDELDLYWLLLHLDFVCSLCCTDWEGLPNPLTVNVKDVRVTLS
jgi:hypothetical protein